MSRGLCNGVTLLALTYLRFPWAECAKQRYYWHVQITIHNLWMLAALSCGAFISFAIPPRVLAQVGVVRTIEGKVSVFSGKPECAPRYGLDLDEGDAVRTGEKSWALLTMMDGAKITVRPDTEVRIDAYRYTEAGESSQNHALFTLTRGAMRVAAGRIANGRNTGFVVQTPAASMDMRGADQDVAYIAPQFTPRGDALVGAYGKSYAGIAVMKNATGAVTIRDGQTAYAEPRVRKPPQILVSDPYFYHWHSYIDRRAAAVIERLESGDVQ